MSAGKAYLSIPTLSAGSRSIIGMEFTEGVTGIDETSTQSAVGNSYYTLSGVKIEGLPTQKGMYVKDGHVVIIK